MAKKTNFKEWSAEYSGGVCGLLLRKDSVPVQRTEMSRSA